MKPYEPRHPLAVLRQIADLTQRELAIMVDRSTRTIQAIEIGRLALSQDLAVRVSHETGAAVQWLLSNDPHAAPTMSLGGLPYTKAVFEHTRASFAAGKNPNLLEINLAQDQIPLDVGPVPLMRRLFDEINSLRHPSLDYWLVTVLAAIFAAAKAGRASLGIYRMAEFAKAMQAEFGQKIDHEFASEAALVFEAGLQRVKIVEILLNRDGTPASSSLSKPDATERDILRETQFGANLEGLDLETLWIDLNQVGDRLKARSNSSQVDYAALSEQLQTLSSTASAKRKSDKRAGGSPR